MGVQNPNGRLLNTPKLCFQINMKILIYILILLPSLCLSQTVDTLRVKMYKTDTSKNPYLTKIYISKIDSLGEVIYTEWNGIIIEEINKRKTKRKNK